MKISIIIGITKFNDFSFVYEDVSLNLDNEYASMFTKYKVFLKLLECYFNYNKFVEF